MSTAPRIKLLTLCIGAALVQMSSLQALADSGVGVDTVTGNWMNPGYPTGPTRMTAEMPTVKRTPSGQMYEYFPLVEEPARGEVAGAVEFGYMHDDGKGRYSKRNEYTDPQQSGLYLNSFNVAAEEKDGARYLDINGGGMGRNDQFYELVTGKYNSWRIKASYNETPHVFSDSWKSLYNGEGTGTLNTGLAMPTMVADNVARTSGVTPNYVGANATCTPAAPCWLYNGKTYGNAVALLAINGITGTPNSVTGVIPTGVIPTTGANGATNATQSGLAAAIAAKLANTPYSELSLVRKKAAVRGDITLNENWSGYASYGGEKRIGARPFAMNENNYSNEIAEPIDYDTHQLLLGAAYKDELNQANLRANFSRFVNNISTLDVQYTQLQSAVSNGVMQHASYTLAPSNDAYDLKGEFARSFPDFYKARFNAAVSYGSNKQNQNLQAPITAAQSADYAAYTMTTLPGSANAGYTTGTALLANWNTVAALSQPTANQEIDSKLINLGLSLKPVDDLAVKGSYRTYQTDDRGGYMAYNPLTGQYGRGPTDNQGVATLEAVVVPVMGAGGLPASAACATPSGVAFTTLVNGVTCSAATLANGSNVPVFNPRRSTRQTNYGVTADYELNRFSSLNGSVEREDYKRQNMERAQTWEDKFKLSYVNRALGDTTLRTSYEHDSKRGGDYNMLIRANNMATGLNGLTIAQQVAIEGGMPMANTKIVLDAAGKVLNATGTVTVNGVTYPALNANLYSRYSSYFRKYDQADRDQNILNGRVNFQARDDLDLGLNLQFKKADYPDSFYGLKKDQQNSLGLDVNYQPEVGRTVTAFYNYQQATKDMSLNAGIANAAAAAVCTTVGQVYSAVNCADTSGDPATGVTGARPSTSAWTSSTTDRNDVLGLGLQNDFGVARLGVDYTYAKSKTHIAYNFGTQAFNANQVNNDAIALVAGSALPDMTTVQNTVVLNLVVPVSKITTLRLMYRYDQMKIRDWHYDNQLKNVISGIDSGTLLLDSGPLDYRINTLGAMLNIKL